MVLGSCGGDNAGEDRGVTLTVGVIGEGVRVAGDCKTKVEDVRGVEVDKRLHPKAQNFGF